MATVLEQFFAQGESPFLLHAANHAPGSAHLRHIVLKGCSTEEADLIFLSLNAAVRPGEAMGAKPLNNML